MKTLRFTTNIKCAGCVATITPVLNSEKKIEQWSVELQDPQRILTVTTDLEPSGVSKLLEQVGYQSTSLSS